MTVVATIINIHNIGFFTCSSGYSQYTTQIYFIQVTFSSQQSESQLLVFGMKKKQNVDENNISDNLDPSTNVFKTDLEILQKLFYSHCCS